MKFKAAEPFHLEWLCKKLSYTPTRDFSGIVALDGDRIMGMVGFDYWTPRSAQLHFTLLDAKCTLPLWAEAKKYLRQHGRKLAVGVTPSNIERALRLIKLYGFVEKYRIVNGWDEGVDMVISECPIHDVEQKRTRTAA